MLSKRQISILFHLTAIIVALLSVHQAFADSGTDGNEKQNFLTEKAEIVPVSYVTLRNKTGDSSPSDYYDGQRGPLQAGICNVSFAKIKGLEEIAESSPIYIPDEKIDLVDIRETGIENLFHEIEQHVQQDNRNLVLYIHGYNIDFEKSCRRSAIFQRSLNLGDRLLLFSWPAEGKMLKYTWDEADLFWSVPYLTDFLRELIKRTGKGRIDVVAHSLGARGIVQSLVRLATIEPGEPLINELVLVAPDIDTDIFRQELPRFQQSVGRITLYLSENDKALLLSHEVHGYPRLGEAGEYLTVLEGVETIDISDINPRRVSGHLYHLFNPEVIADLDRLLNKKEAADHRPNLKKISKDGFFYWQLLSSEN